MEPIYVTGHRNPDTDSIVSAMAYAALRNALGDREFVPARLGHISDETRLVLDRFGFEPPVRIQTMRTQVRDLDYDTPPALSGAVTVSRAWAALQSNKAKSIPAIPVTNENGELYGMLSPSEIASYDMRTLSDSRVDKIPVFNLLSVLDGKILNESGYLADTISGEVSIALPQNNENLLFKGPDAIVIVGEQPEMARRAVEQQVSCLIVCQAELPEQLRQMQTNTCIIATPFDAYKAARMICARSCSKAAIAATRFSMRMTRLSAPSPGITSSSRAASASCWSIIMRRRSPSRGSSRRRSWRSSTTIGWPTSRPAAPFTSVMSLSARPRRSSPKCIRNAASCRPQSWPV